MSASVVYEEARAAWRAGDAGRALTLCAGLPRRCAERLRVVILRARALLRLRRPREAVVLLERVPLARVRRADAAEIAMLLGIAHARCGNAGTGFRLLAHAEELAPPHGELRSEIALSIGLAHYQNRAFVEARSALERVSPDAGIVHARALECRGWIAKTCGELDAAYAFFDASLRELERHPPVDGLIEANLVATMAYIAIELLDVARWEAMSLRGDAVRWETPGLEYFACWFALDRSMAHEIAGRPRDALHAARLAADRAPSPAFRLFADCRRAAVLLAYGEVLGYEDSAAAIRAQLDAIDVRLLEDFEEVNLPVVVAETLALVGDGAGAADALRRLDRMTQSQLSLLHDEPMKRAYLAYVEGLVAQANADAFRARHRFRESLRTFDEMGMRRRSLIVALRAAQLTRDAALLDRVRTLVRPLPAASWLRRAARDLESARADPLLASLTRAEREVLELLGAGKSTAQIAAERDRSPQTIRNTISNLLRTFGVDNRQALINECATRGAFARQRETRTVTASEPAERSRSLPRESAERGSVRRP